MFMPTSLFLLPHSNSMLYSYVVLSALTLGVDTVYASMFPFLWKALPSLPVPRTETDELNYAEGTLHEQGV
jgi:hypothetical protein